MRQPVSPFDFGPRVLQILGIPNENVKEIHIHVTPDEYVTIDVKMTLEKDAADKIADAMQTYTISEPCNAPKA